MGLAQGVNPGFGAEGDDVRSEAKDPLVQLIGGVDLDGVTRPTGVGRRQVEVTLGTVDGLAVEVVGQQGRRSPAEFLNPL